MGSILGTRNLGHLRRDAMYATAIVVVICVFLKTFESNHSPLGPGVSQTAKTLIHDANRYYEMSMQDTNTHVRFQHAAYAHAHLRAARKLIHDSELERLSKLSIHELQNMISQQERATQKEMLKQCPKLKVIPNQASPTKPPTVLPRWMY